MDAIVEKSTVIGIESGHTLDKPVQVKTVKCPTRIVICWFMVIIFVMVSVGLNIYFLVEHFQTKGLAVDRKTEILGESCEITTFNMTLDSKLAGAILRVIPDCAASLNNPNSTRLLATTSCARRTSLGFCLFCAFYNPYGICTQYTNVDPKSIIKGAAVAWIKCVLDNVEVIAYAVETCTQIGLQNLLIDLAVAAISTAKKLLCFPGKTNVITDSGIKELGSLKIGDSILSLVGGHLEYTKITAWLHYDHNSSSNQYLRITDEANSSFVASAHHNIAVLNQSYIFAKDLLSERLHGLGKGIKKIEVIEEKGIFAPMTASGNYFILNSNNEKVLAHCFAHVKDPIMYENVVHTAISVYDTFFEQSYQEMHPLGNWFERALDLVCEK